MAKKTLVQNMEQAQINKNQADSLKEHLVRQMKMLYVMEMTMSRYAGGLRETYQKLLDLGLNKKALGDLRKGILEMNRAEKHYCDGVDALWSVWHYDDNKDEISEFEQNAYTAISALIENACRATPEGRYKKDYQYLAFIPQEELKSLNEWYGSLHKTDGQKLEII